MSLSDLAVDPESYLEKIVTVNGFISESVSPDAVYTSAYLTDGQMGHQMQLLIQSATGKWIESDSKIEVSGMLSYQETSLRWALLTQGPDILIDGSHVPTVHRLDWATEATWSYQSGSKVVLAGTLHIEDGVWDLVGPSGNSICVIPTVGDIAAAEEGNYNNSIFFINKDCKSFYSIVKFFFFK